MGFTHFRVGHAGALHKNKIANNNNNAESISKRATPNPTCFTGGFYTSPANGATIDSMTPLNVTWDPTCIDTANADIYLIAPGADRARIHVWQSIPFATGQATVHLMPRWWNSTSSQSLQITIVGAGTPPSFTDLPAGPVITATYTAPASGPPPPEADINQVDSGVTPPSGALGGSSKHLAPGKTAAAVLLPLLFVLLLIFAYLKHQRTRVTKKTKQFSVAVDQRMSVISTDWKSMSAAGANAAIRNSIAVNRDSSAFAFGGIRPVSTIDGEDGGQAGVGSGAMGQMKQVRTGTGVGLRNPNPGAAAAFAAERASRISRVSFADTARPSGETARRTRNFGSTYIPPLPTRGDVMSTATALSVYPDSEVEGSSDSEKVRGGEEKVRVSSEKARGSPTLSPKQTQGPLTLTSEDIRARIQGRTGREDEEFDEVMPALSMMRTGIDTATSPTNAQYASYSNNSNQNNQDDYLFTPLPAPPTPIHQKAMSAHPSSPASLSPFSQNFAGSPPAYGTLPLYQQQAPPSPVVAQAQPQVMSPDQMLRAYAERKAAGSPSLYPSSPSAYNPTFGTAKKGRKISLRGSFGGRKAAKEERVEKPKVVISYPMPAGTSGAGGMAGVGAGAGAAYTIGEDEEDYESAYVGTAN